jgi:hypothetical protein
VWETVEVPRAPPLPLPLRPTSRRAVVTAAVGAEAEACLRTSGPALLAYARRLGADFHVLTSAPTSSWPMSVKFYLPRVLEHYDQAAYIDADVWVRPGAVDLFELAGDAEWAACNTRQHHERLNPDLLATYRAFLRDFTDLRSTPFYFNCGVQVARASAAHLLGPLRIMPKHHCGEEWLINARVAEAHAKGLLRMRVLDPRANWQNWQDPGFTEAPDDALLHWSGGGVLRIDRAAQMAAAAR